jgi:hypothetical protein
MNNTVQPPEAHFLRGVLVCPRCSNDVLEAVADGEDTNFLCHGCWTCWHWDLGYLISVPPSTCPGCHHKEECLRRRAMEVDSPSTQSA